MAGYFLRMAFSYDPRGLIGRAAGAARMGLDVYSWAEEQVVGAIRHGLDSLDPAEQVEDVAREAESEAARPDPPSSLNGR